MKNDDSIASHDLGSFASKAGNEHVSDEHACPSLAKAVLSLWAVSHENGL